MSMLIDIDQWCAHAANQIAVIFEDDEARLNPASQMDAIHESLMELLIHNATLWGFEDEVRRTDIPDSEIARFKRLIDRENQLRNDSIDRTDAVLRAEVERQNIDQNEDLPLNTETPGSAFDRLVILQLRHYHLGKELTRTDATAEHIEKCRTKQAEVKERIADLSTSLRELLEDIFTGRKRLKSYATHKLYNDPETNPAVRAANKG